MELVDVHFAIGMSKLGGLAVLNLEGVQTRYKNPQEVLQKIVETEQIRKSRGYCKRSTRNQCSRI